MADKRSPYQLVNSRRISEPSTIWLSLTSLLLCRHQIPYLQPTSTAAKISRVTSIGNELKRRVDGWSSTKKLMENWSCARIHRAYLEHPRTDVSRSITMVMVVGFRPLRIQVGFHLSNDRTHSMAAINGGDPNYVSKSWDDPPKYLGCYGVGVASRFKISEGTKVAWHGALYPPRVGAEAMAEMRFQMSRLSEPNMAMATENHINFFE